MTEQLARLARRRAQMAENKDRRLSFWGNRPWGVPRYGGDKDPARKQCPPGERRETDENSAAEPIGQRANKAE
jgi:hypothetical protein